MKKLIYKLIYRYYRNKDKNNFRNKISHAVYHKKPYTDIKFHNSLEYNSKYLPDESKEYLIYLKENIHHINRLKEKGDIINKRLYYKDDIIIVQHSMLYGFKDIKSLDDYLSIYGVYDYDKSHFQGLLYVEFEDKEVHKKYQPNQCNYPIGILNIKWVETEEERTSRLRNEKLNYIL